ncbi:MAG: hypothetical protein EOL97_06725 [Spirochaetia bacterium]|nr:hypothetical protein [Spirochaetia bacterium]
MVSNGILKMKIGYKVNKKDYNKEEEFNTKCLEVQGFVNNNKGLRILENDEGIEIIEEIVDETQELLYAFEAYLVDTKDLVIECFEKGLVFKEEYPEEFEKREQARIKINELRNIIK